MRQVILHHFKPSFGDAKVCRAYDGYIKCGQTRGAEIHVVTKQPAKPAEPQPSTSAVLKGKSTLCQERAICILMAGHAGPHQWAVDSSAQAYGSEADPVLGGPSPVPEHFRSTSRPKITGKYGAPRPWK